ncbi:MAG: hypothetical protein HYX90_06020 [Chloroflexi bacterium]|nr:hypothetical protein [Chloroflexota bacterium]
MSRIVLSLALLIVATGFLSACGSGAVSPPGSPGSSKTAPASEYIYPGKLETDQDAVAAVAAFLQSEARNNDAIRYLAEYSMVVEKRVARLSDDKQAWYVTFSMDARPDADQGEKPYWESAAWFVFRDGKVMPSTRQGGHATKILLDLRASRSQG